MPFFVASTTSSPRVEGKHVHEAVVFRQLDRLDPDASSCVFRRPRLIFFTCPFRVARKRYLSSAKSFTWVTAVIFSSFSALMRLITGLPFDERGASGMVWTFLTYAFPAVVKRMM